MCELCRFEREKNYNICCNLLKTTNSESEKTSLNGSTKKLIFNRRELVESICFMAAKHLQEFESTKMAKLDVLGDIPRVQ